MVLQALITIGFLYSYCHWISYMDKKTVKISMEENWPFTSLGLMWFLMTLNYFHIHTVKTWFWRYRQCYEECWGCCYKYIALFKQFHLWVKIKSEKQQTNKQHQCNHCIAMSHWDSEQYHFLRLASYRPCEVSWRQ